MTVLEKLLFFLVYCFAVNNLFWKGSNEAMNHFFKGTVVVVGVTIVIMVINIIINIICNKNGIDLNSISMTMFSTFTGMLLSTSIYDRWIKNEKDKE